MTDHSQRPTATIYQFPSRKAVREAEPKDARQHAGSPHGTAQGIIDGPCWYHEEAIVMASTDDRRR